MSACRIGFKAMGGHCEIVLDGLAEPDAQVISAPAMAEVLRIEQPAATLDAPELMAK
jgi:hypothetical protein